MPNPSGGGNTNSPELSLLKFLPLTYHHSHFLAATLDFTSFFTIAFLGVALFFTAWLFWIRYICISVLRHRSNATAFASLDSNHKIPFYALYWEDSLREVGAVTIIFTDTRSLPVQFTHFNHTSRRRKICKWVSNATFYSYCLWFQSEDESQCLFTHSYGHRPYSSTQLTSQQFLRITLLRHEFCGYNFGSDVLQLCGLLSC